MKAVNDSIVVVGYGIGGKGTPQIVITFEAELEPAESEGLSFGVFQKIPALLELIQAGVKSKHVYDIDELDGGKQHTFRFWGLPSGSRQDEGDAILTLMKCVMSGRVEFEVLEGCVKMKARLKTSLEELRGTDIGTIGDLLHSTTFLDGGVSQFDLEDVPSDLVVDTPPKLAPQRDMFTKPVEPFSLEVVKPAPTVRIVSGPPGNIEEVLTGAVITITGFPESYDIMVINHLSTLGGLSRAEAKRITKSVKSGTPMKLDVSQCKDTFALLTALDDGEVLYEFDGDRPSIPVLSNVEEPLDEDSTEADLVLSWPETKMRESMRSDQVQFTELLVSAGGVDFDKFKALYCAMTQGATRSEDPTFIARRWVKWLKQTPLPSAKMG